MSETTMQPTEIDVLRARLAEGLAFVPARLVRVLLTEYDAALEALPAYVSDNDALSAQARAAEFRRIEAERTLQDTADELLRIVGEIRSAVAPRAPQDRETTDGTL